MKTTLCCVAVLSCLTIAPAIQAEDRCDGGFFGGGFGGGFSGHHGHYSSSHSCTQVPYVPVTNHGYSSSTYVHTVPTTPVYTCPPKPHVTCNPVPPGSSATFVFHKPHCHKTPVINGGGSSSTFVFHTPNCPKTPVINHGKHGSSTYICHTPNCSKPPVTIGKPVGKPVGSGSSSHHFVAHRSAGTQDGAVSRND